MTNHVHVYTSLLINKKLFNANDNELQSIFYYKTRFTISLTDLKTFMEIDAPDNTQLIKHLLSLGFQHKQICSILNLNSSTVSYHTKKEVKHEYVSKVINKLTQLAWDTTRNL